MKIILAKPIIESSKKIYTVHPLSLGYLATALRESNDVSILDCENRGYAAADFARHLEHEKPELVGLTVFSHNKKSVLDSIAVIRGALPGAVIVIGGPHVNAKGAKVFEEFPGIDYAMAGEAEVSIVKLIEALEGKAPEALKDIPGLIYRTEEGQLRSAPGVFYEDISRFDPMPYDLLGIRDYFGGLPQGLFYRHKELVSIITSRGCPYPCTFCAGSVNNGKKVRYRMAENVLEEIGLLVKKYGVKEIHILDDNFTFEKDYAAGLCEELIRRDYRLDLALPNGIRLDRIDDELLSLMRRAGFYALSFGVESGSDETLKKIKKLETTEFIRKQITLASRHGFRLTGTFIIGFPWETEADVETTLRFAKSLPLDHAAFGNFTPLPATEITDGLIGCGELDANYEVPFTWGEITYSPRNISIARLKELQRKCVFGFYFPKRLHLILGNVKLSNVMHFLRRLLLLFKKQ